MEIVRREKTGADEFKVRQRRAQQMLRGDLDSDELEQHVRESIITTTLDKAVGWARGNALFPMTFGLACCAIEMMSIVASRVDVARFGFEAFRASPRQADLLILSGRVSIKMAPIVRPHLRPDARAEVLHRDGRLLVVDGRLQQLRDRPGGQVHARRRPRARLPAAARGAHARHPAAALDDPGRPQPGLAGALQRRSAPRSSCPTRRRTGPASTSIRRGTPRVPDATGLELLAQELRESQPDERARHRALPRQGGAARRPAAIRATLRSCASKGFTFLASVHGLDYYPDEPRLGVQYELLDMAQLDRITVKLRVPTDAARRRVGHARLADGRPPGARGLRHVRRGLRRPPRPAADPHARGLRGLPAAPRLPDRRRAGPLHARTRPFGRDYTA
jgi:hypothetical protein